MLRKNQANVNKEIYSDVILPKRRHFADVIKKSHHLNRLTFSAPVPADRGLFFYIQHADKSAFRQISYYSHDNKRHSYTDYGI